MSKQTLIFNGKVYLEREKFTEAILIEDGIIKKVGKKEELLPLCLEDCNKIDCEGKTVIPGLNDSHLHLIQFAEVLQEVSTFDCTSVEDLVERCIKFKKENPELTKHCIHAIGWNQDYFPDKRIPTRFDLDKISTEIPIILERVCGHILSTNTKAIELLGIDGNSPQWPGGTFMIGEDGYPNGIFTENACNFVKKLIPDYTMEDRERMLIKSMEQAVSYGLTSVQSNDIGTTIVKSTDEHFAMFKKLFKEGKGLLRYRHQVCFTDIEEFKKYVTDGEFTRDGYSEENWITLGPLKLFKDGSLGARTALMCKPYNDDPSTIGEHFTTTEEMEQYCAIAKDYGIQVVTHVIGDRAIKETIECYKKAFIDGENKLRHALVHCQITDREMLEDIAKSGILVMYQPIFLDYDMKIVEDRCGKELASTSYAFNTLDKLGGKISYGTDCPVESCNPFPNIYSAVTRKDANGQPINGFYPEECVDIYTAIDAYTIGSAYAEFCEDRKGRIKENYYGDIVILDKDIFTVDPVEIRNIKPVITMVGGKIVYSQK